jgi:pectinesterase
MKRFFFVVLCILLVTEAVFAQTGNPQQHKYVFTVAKDGTGNYKFIQDAIDAMRVYPLASITLYIKNGVYNEKIVLPTDNTDVSFIGESVEKTIITFNDYSGRGRLNTFTSYTAKISGNRFVAENITFVNSAGPVGQALALYVDADKAVFKNCRFLGNQDTIFATGENARQYFVDCFIEGTTDFIFGPATALFQRCTIRSKSNSYITAANTTPGKKFGFVFLDCKIIIDSSVTKVFLGRPWRAYSKTVFIGCDLPKQIAPEGWNNWNNSENEKTAYYAEYKNTGAGADISKRVSWSRQLTDKEVKEYTPENIFSNSSAVAQESNWFLQVRTKPFEWPVNQAVK